MDRVKQRSSLIVFMHITPGFAAHAPPTGVNITKIMTCPAKVLLWHVFCWWCVVR